MTFVRCLISRIHPKYFSLSSFVYLSPLIRLVSFGAESVVLDNPANLFLRACAPPWPTHRWSTHVGHGKPPSHPSVAVDTNTRTRAGLVNGNRKLHILGNRKLRTFMRFPWRAAVTSALGVDRVLGWAAGAERPEPRPRTSPFRPGRVAITWLPGQRLPAPAMPRWFAEGSDGHASGSCCRGC